MAGLDMLAAVRALPDKHGPTRAVDLPSLLERIQQKVPGLVAAYLFGSRAHQTGSVRSDIDLLLITSEPSAAVSLGAFFFQLESYIDAFVVSGATATSLANFSFISGTSETDLLSKLQAVEVWRGEWTGREAHRVQVVLTDYAPPFTIAIVSNPRVVSQPASAVDLLVMVTLDVERDAVVNELANAAYVPKLGRSPAHVRGSIRRHRGGERIVAVCTLPRAGNVASAVMTSRAIAALNPDAVVLLGILGGIQTSKRELSFGDVIIATSVVDYESSKIGPGKGPHGVNQAVSDQLLQQVKSHDLRGWSNGLPSKPLKAKRSGTLHYYGVVASGEKVVADGAWAKRLRRLDRKIIGVETEAYGVAAACNAAADPTPFLVVKGISDLSDRRKDDRWQAFASIASARLATYLVVERIL